MTKLAFVVGLAMLAGASPLLAQSDPVRSALDRLVAAYPDALAGHDGKALRWRDGTLMPVSDGTDSKTFAQLLRHASIADQFRIPYPRGPLESRRRSMPIRAASAMPPFSRRCTATAKRAKSSRHLVSIAWLPKTWGKSIRVTSLNHVDERLRAVSAEIDALPDKIKRAAYPIAGTYNCRAVADTGQPSAHGYGIAIDLNTAFSDYWYWRPHNGRIVYRNRLPQEIVTIFEKHGFIWGGKWYHFDTMHFEFRPELLVTQ